MLEQFLTGIDISFMIFLAQSACWFLFSYQLSFTWFCIGSAALWYFRVLFIFNSPLNTTNIVLLHWSWQFWSRPTHCQTSHHLLLLLWQNSHLPIYLQPGKVHVTMLIIHLWQKIALVLMLCFIVCHLSQFSIKACLLAEASPPFSEFSPNKKGACQKGYWLFHPLLSVSNPF